MKEYLTYEQLEAFVEKVEKLRAEGLPTHVVMARLGVPRATLSTRLRRSREMKEKNG